MKKSALQLTTADNVATALDDIAAGEAVVIADTEGAELETIRALSPIPRGHKIALKKLAPNAPVLKYGFQIGTAIREIPVGVHVHTQNLSSARGRGDL